MRFIFLLAMWFTLFSRICLGEVGVVTAPNDGFLALRSEPSTTQGVRLAKIPHNTEIGLSECVSVSPAERWCKTTYRGSAGWVLDRYVAKPKPDRLLIDVAAAVVKKNSVPGMKFKLVVEEVIGDFARVRAVDPRDATDATDDALVYLKRVRGTWIGVTLGTSFERKDLIKQGFPRRIIQWAD